MFMAAVVAGPVYKLLDKKHIPGSNWPTFLDYAASYFK